MAWLDAFGDCVLPDGAKLEAADGDDVPELASFLLFEDDFDSLALESCSC